MEACAAMILAAAGEERMRSSRPKPVHLLCGRPMVQYVIDSLSGIDVDRIVVVVGEGAELVTKKLSETAADPRLVFAEQRSPRGSAETALVGLDVFHDDLGDDDIVVLPGNVPLLRPDAVAALMEHHRATHAAATILAIGVDTSSTFGRIVPGRDPGTAARITAGSDRYDESWLGDGGVYCFRRSLLAPAIRRLRPHPESGLYLLSEVVEVLTDAGHRVDVFDAGEPEDLQPVDDRTQLAAAEATIRGRTNRHWMQRGVTMVDPARTYIDTTVQLAADVTLFPGTILQGATVVGVGAEIGPDTRLIDCAVGAGARVEKTMGRDAEVGDDARVGPFAVLDPGAQVASAAVTGPFYHATHPDGAAGEPAGPTGAGPTPSPPNGPGPDQEI